MTIWVAGVLTLSWVQPVLAAPAPTATPDQVRFFESRVRPVLVEHCVKCHGPAKQKSGLRLDSRAAILAGGDTGPAVVPGNLDESLLVTAIRHEDDLLKMPPSRKLDKEQVADLIHWVEIGAPWPGAEQEAAAPSGTRKGEFQITDKDRAHWAFQPVQRPPVPEVKDSGGVRNPIDAFLLARLEARGLKPNPPAQKHELIRRATFDLTGLPPTLAEVEAFLADQSPTAYEAMIDRLLASPRYGEKWGRHWLDLVRFAETNSYERDNPKPNAWRYRDYVIQSFNQDKPYDRFVREQLAGDELPDGGIEGLIATGYYRLGIWDDEPTDRDQAKYDGLDDLVATTGQVFLGLTVDCARCHDHKIDPIPQKDYYRLLSFFQNINHFRNGGPTDETLIETDPTSRQAFEQRTMEHERQLKDVREAIAEIEHEFRLGLARKTASNSESAEPKETKGVSLAELIQDEGARVLGEQRFQRYRELHRRLSSLSRERVAGDFALCVTEAGPQAAETHVLLRGNPHTPGDKVEPAFLTVLNTPSPSIPTPPPGAGTTGRRRVLADWISAPDNPLTARVMANRLWQHHFGRGIVRSPNNFGTQGDKPTHPELLDWLAAELVAQGWRLKPIHRLIVTSNAYQMASSGNAEALAKDPVNDLFWRFDMRRLTGEEIRDAILAVSGTLNLKMAGPGVYPEIPAEVLAGQSMPGKGWGKSPPSEQARRSVYIHVKRSLLMPILESFDLAETDRSTPVRFSTTQPTQALAMLNGAFLNQQAARFADRLQCEAGADLDAQVRMALRLATAREPEAAEVRRGVELIRTFAISEAAELDAGRKAFCLVVLNLNEFLYLD
jgi:hypothetical protein